MDVKEASMMWRSIRAFKPQHIPREVLEEIIREASWSPSGYNIQPSVRLDNHRGSISGEEADGESKGAGGVQEVCDFFRPP
ncbi:nitroreductase family protein [Chloroflexota bacterium]